jgi:prophage regulatory protein
MSSAKYLSDKKLAERYDTHRATIWRWVREGKLPKPVKLTSGSTRWSIADLEQWEAGKDSGQ